MLFLDIVCALTSLAKTRHSFSLLSVAYVQSRVISLSYHLPQSIIDTSRGVFSPGAYEHKTVYPAALYPGETHALCLASYPRIKHRN